MDEDRPIPEPDESVARLFLEWRSPRFGNANPQRMNNPVWEWLIRSRANSYAAMQRFNCPSACEAGPTWCFERFGQSKTELADGRTVFIAGEHEDSYDPDFCIYNDVVVQRPNGDLDILGYPREVFTPTDFHSATVIGDRIVLIGSLGYPEDRKFGSTQVLQLKLSDFQISQITASGEAPGWIHRHEAELRGEDVVIRGGIIDRGHKGEWIENIDDWALDLGSSRWRRLTERKWEQWEFRRADGKTNNLWRMRSDQMMRDLGLSQTIEEQFAKMPPIIAQIMREQPPLPKFDLRDLYCPPVQHETIPAGEDDFGVFRIRVDGVTVRYVEEMYSIRLVCEGELASHLVATLVTDLQKKLSAAELVEYEARRAGF